ncbi:hypothetical protein IQ06DRAFT_27862 [Phaeosphaeriaceae sp. SRC1lsM3a]|nr:hypothetical protein IQ06DRAFT_27862 [Stagonospora sp. SRC1lsM3a]
MTFCPRFPRVTSHRSGPFGHAGKASEPRRNINNSNRLLDCKLPHKLVTRTTVTQQLNKILAAKSGVAAIPSDIPSNRQTLLLPGTTFLQPLHGSLKFHQHPSIRRSHLLVYLRRNCTARTLLPHVVSSSLAVSIRLFGCFSLWYRPNHVGLMHTILLVHTYAFCTPVLGVTDPLYWQCGVWFVLRDLDVEVVWCGGEDCQRRDRRGCL